MTKISSLWIKDIKNLSSMLFCHKKSFSSWLSHKFIIYIISKDSAAKIQQLLLYTI